MAPAPPTNVRADLTSFVGRRAALDAIEGRIADGSRLVTVLGPAGCGKSRVAAEVARRALDGAWATGGVWRCDLAHVGADDELCAALGQAIGVPLDSDEGRPPAEQLGEALAGRGPTLLILDNIERARDAVCERVAGWVSRATELVVLVTSRVSVRVAGEVTLELGPLSLPCDGPDSEAAALFVQRAQAVQAAWTPSADELDVIGKIVTRLDGMPLAIELAASRMRALGVVQLERLLARRFDLLVSGAGSGRQTTLRGALDWSWELLDDVQREALAHCAVFAGGFDLDAAEVLDLSAFTDAWALDVVQSLCECSLVHAYEPPSRPGTRRFRLYESIRAYALERLEASGRAAGAQERHARYYLGLAESASTRLRGPDEAAALDDLRLEVHNLIAVHRRALAPPRGAEDVAWALDAALAVDVVLEQQGPVALRVSLLDAALAAAGEGVGSERVDRAHLARASARLVQGEVGPALEELEGVVVRAHLRGRRGLEADATRALARATCLDGRIAEAADRYVAAQRLYAELGDRWGQGQALCALAAMRGILAGPEASRGPYREALELARALGAPSLLAVALGNLGSLEHDAGHTGLAREYVGRALELARSSGDRFREANYATSLGSVALEERDLAAAREAFTEALRVQRAIGNPRWEGFSRAYLGFAAEVSGDAEGARGAYAEALVRLRAFGHPLTTGLVLCWSARHEARSDQIEVAQARLDEARRCFEGAGGGVIQHAAGIAGGHLALARARAASGADAARLRAEAEAASAAAQVPGPDGVAPTQASSEVRMCLALLTEELARAAGAGAGPILEVRGDGFCTPGAPPVSLATRRALKGIFRALVARHRAAPGTGVSADELLEAGWPGERITPEAGANRVYTAIASLRRMGLRDLLIRRDDGYQLRPEVQLSEG